MNQLLQRRSDSDRRNGDRRHDDRRALLDGQSGMRLDGPNRRNTFPQAILRRTAAVAAVRPDGVSAPGKNRREDPENEDYGNFSVVHGPPFRGVNTVVSTDFPPN